MRQSMTKMTFWAILVALAIGFVLGRMWAPSETGATTATGSPIADATATREAEIEELEQLRTQVAEQATACAPTPTPAATATPVPPTAQGVPVPYGENWTVEVTGASSLMSTSVDMPEGIFIVVNLTVTNNESSERNFPVSELTLLDEAGRTFVSDPIASSHVHVGDDINLKIDPSIPTETAVVFDVATDAGTQFILESTADPTFRVQVSLEMRG